MEISLHSERLNQHCRVCGQELGQQHTPKQRHSKQLLGGLNIDIAKDDKFIHPNYVCIVCRLKLDYWQKRKNKKKITTPLDMTVAVFQAHTDDQCKICCNTQTIGNNTSTTTCLHDVVRDVSVKYNFIYAVKDDVSYSMIIDFETRKVVKCITVKPSGEWTLHIKDNVIPVEGFQHFSSLTPSNIFPFFEALQGLKLCKGNPDFADLINKGAVLKSRSGETVAVIEGNTIRHVQCKILCSEECCCVCYMYRSSLYSRQGTKTKENTTPSSHKRNDQLSRQELGYKLDLLQKERRMLKRRNGTLEQRMASVFTRRSIELNAADNNLLQMMTTTSEDKFSSWLPEGSPQRLLWEEQIKSAKSKTKTAMRWHPGIVRFCIAVHHKSPAAYETIRSSGFLNLPHQNTLKRYIHYTDIGAGINIDVVKRIRLKAKLSDGEHKRYVTLAFDEMKIKSGLVLSGSSGRLSGLIDLDTFNNEVLRFERQCKGEKEPGMATHMLVIMVRGICSSLCEPLCFYPGQGASGSQLISIVTSAISAIEMQGFQVKALVGDGASCNRKLFNILALSNEGHYMTHPLDATRNIYFFSDVPHLIKTTRNNWENSGWNRKSRCLKFKDQPIMWNHLNSLYEWDLGIGKDAPGLRCLHKLSHEHLHLNPALRMRVYLAAQVLSESVANALSMRGDPQTKSTEYFVRMFNKFFDCLNGSNTLTWKAKNKPDLKPYSSVSDPRFEWLTKDFLGFLQEWEDEASSMKGLTKDEKKRLCLSTQTLEGLRITVKSFVTLTKELLKDGGVKYILSEKFSQDPLEEYFSKQRSAGGCNDNPTAEEFKNNFLALHVAGDCVSAARRGNCRNAQRDQRNDLLSDEPLPKRPRTVGKTQATVI